MTDHATAHHGSLERSTRSEKLPYAALLAFAMTGFIAILTETLPAGLLPQIGAGLNVSEVLAGQLVTLYALGSIVAAIPLTVATRGWPRRRVLLITVGGFLLFNTVTTFSTHYGLTLVSRFLAGMAAGLSWGIMAGYARRLVPGSLQGRALAIAMLGTPVALSLGTPAGTWLGNVMGWRASFGIMSALALVLAAWIVMAVPDRPGQTDTERLPLRKVFCMPGVRPVLFVVLTWMLGHNILYTYIAPFLMQSGLGERVDLVLLVFGLSSLLGIWIIGVLVDRWLRRLTLVCLAVFALTALVLALATTSPWVIYACMAVWGLSFGGSATLLLTAAADSAGEHVDVVQAMLTTSWNVAIAGGGVFGGVLLAQAGVMSFPWALLGLSLIALVTVWVNGRYSFKPGRR
ncbi:MULTISPECIES: MFS transporter [unclassified Pseudomonas]|uniref:MFS transporter n=1 Tax=unclassified Pseudomonas TaxID=196821 RepID=UPI002AC9831A|nr:MULTISPECIES: MFS transporter [unclassified Pseudomonas]MEB0048546.1 MFS transporter [Pseudomonas sp. Dout3]MEB0099409.1 MFS transporter [Pseudomonas sp. DC1.2]WPX57174.1 MFS transporter [Pseudomonas sp. DC1.2]